MDSILGRAHGRADKSHTANRNNNQKPVETAGTLALWQQGLLMANLYDSFETGNPFAVDYAAFGFDSGTIAYSGFLSSFSNAISTLGGYGSFSESGFSDGGFGAGGGFASSGGGFSGGGGGFSSVC
jgi:hypothetical protein